MALRRGLAWRCGPSAAPRSPAALRAWRRRRAAGRADGINGVVVTRARAGRRGVGVRGGERMIFGRATEEITACRAAGIAVEVVPGISAAQGAASRLGVSLTHRERARRLQYVTGHGSDGRLPADIDWKSIADPGATTILYMPVQTPTACAASAIAPGRHAATPAGPGF